jgi:hypothetical protein
MTMPITERATHHDTCATMEGKRHCTCDVTKGVEKVVRQCSGELVDKVMYIQEQARLHGGGNADFVFLKAIMPIVRKHVQAARQVRE